MKAYKTNTTNIQYNSGNSSIYKGNLFKLGVLLAGLTAAAVGTEGCASKHGNLRVTEENERQIVKNPNGTYTAILPFSKDSGYKVSATSRDLQMAINKAEMGLGQMKDFNLTPADLAKADVNGDKTLDERESMHALVNKNPNTVHSYRRTPSGIEDYIQGKIEGDKIKPSRPKDEEHKVPQESSPKYIPDDEAMKILGITKPSELVKYFDADDPSKVIRTSRQIDNKLYGLVDLLVDRSNKANRVLYSKTLNLVRKIADIDGNGVIVFPEYNVVERVVVDDITKQYEHSKKLKELKEVEKDLEEQIKDSSERINELK